MDLEKEKIKNIQNTKPMHIKLEENYINSVEAPFLEQKKKKLDEMRNFYRPI